jgi:hypothetical protein
VLALRADQRDQFLLEQLVQHLQADADREREQTLTHRAGQIVESKLHLARQAQPLELIDLSDPRTMVPLHRTVLLIEWPRSPPPLPAGGDGGPPLKNNRLRDKLNTQLRLRL